MPSVLTFVRGVPIGISRTLLQHPFVRFPTSAVALRVRTRWHTTYAPEGIPRTFYWHSTYKILAFRVLLNKEARDTRDQKINQEVQE
jgi:hypothetical protein